MKTHCWESSLPAWGTGIGTGSDLPVAEETVLDDLHDKVGSLPLCHVRAEPVSGQRRRRLWELVPLRDILM